MQELKCQWKNKESETAKNEGRPSNLRISPAGLMDNNGSGQQDRRRITNHIKG